MEIIFQYDNLAPFFSGPELVFTLSVVRIALAGTSTVSLILQREEGKRSGGGGGIRRKKGRGRGRGRKRGRWWRCKGIIIITTDVKTNMIQL